MQVTVLFLIIIKFIEEIDTYYAAYNNSQNNRYTIKVFTRRYNADFKPVDNLF